MPRFEDFAHTLGATIGDLSASERRFECRWRLLVDSGREALTVGDGARANATYPSLAATAVGLLRLAQSPAGSLLAPMAVGVSAVHGAQAAFAIDDDQMALYRLLDGAGHLIDTVALSGRPLALRVNCSRHARRIIALVKDDMWNVEQERLDDRMTGIAEQWAAAAQSLAVAARDACRAIDRPTIH